MSQTTANDGKKLIHTKCPCCSETAQVYVDLEGYKKWKSGELVQNAFPEASPTFREFLITGMCSACQVQIFGDPAEDREDPGEDWCEE